MDFTADGGCSLRPFPVEKWEAQDSGVSKVVEFALGGGGGATRLNCSREWSCFGGCICLFPMFHQG